MTTEAKIETSHRTGKTGANKLWTIVLKMLDIKDKSCISRNAHKVKGA